MEKTKNQAVAEDLYALLTGIDPAGLPPVIFDDTHRWSYGDVENNGVYYHPQLTNYAHQTFEKVFFEATGLHYSDLSGRDPRHEDARRQHSIGRRITFPVEWLHQWMRRPMRAGDLFHTYIDMVELGKNRIGVRALIYNEAKELAAVVIWLRRARVLEPAPEPVDIPSWFPRRQPFQMQRVRDH